MKPTETSSPFMTLPELQRHYANCSRSFIYTAVNSGELPVPVKLGGKILFPRAAIMKMDAERQEQAERATQERLAERAVA